MTAFLLFLQDKQPPGFALLKNAKIRVDPAEGYRISEFEEAIWSDSIVELRQRLQKPVLLNTREAKDLVRFKYSEYEIASGDFHFDDLPSSLLNETSDKELFGYSFPIFWVVEPDKEKVINFLTDKLVAEATDAISAEQLKTLWNDYVNRMFFKHDGTAFTELAFLHDEMIGALIDRIKELPCAPAEESWDVLNEEVDWDAEDDWE